MSTTQSAPKKEIRVPLEPDAAEKIEQAAKINRRARGAEIAYRIERELREEKG